MPGQLKSDAKCPICGEPLEALVDETSGDGVKRVYYHGKLFPKRRRMLPCRRVFVSHVIAHEERYALEVHA